MLISELHETSYRDSMNEQDNSESESEEYMSLDSRKKKRLKFPKKPDSFLPVDDQGNYSKSVRKLENIMEILCLLCNVKNTFFFKFYFRCFS